MIPKTKILSSRVVYRGRVFDLRSELVLEPGGVKARRELACHPGSVVLLPILPDGRLVLVRQYRHAARKLLWELVAGSIEPGESFRQAANRELAEETGFRGRSLKHILSFYPSPGFLTERMHLWECRGLSPHKASPDPDERIECRAFSRRTLKEMMRAGKIEDAKTLIGLCWYFSRASAGS